MERSEPSSQARDLDLAVFDHNNARLAVYTGAIKRYVQSVMWLILWTYGVHCVPSAVLSHGWESVSIVRGCKYVVDWLVFS